MDSAGLHGGAGRGMSRWLLLRGLPRDARAAPHLMVMLVSAVATVLLVRAFLAAAGYPRIGGGGLHIAHVLWGGLLMVTGLVLLLSFAGPVIRPVAAVLSGVGIGLFIDEVGNFVTSDNDYFYRPAAALMYVIIAGLVLLVDPRRLARRLHRVLRTPRTAELLPRAHGGGAHRRDRVRDRELRPPAVPSRPVRTGGRGSAV